MLRRLLAVLLFLSASIDRLPAEDLFKAEPVTKPTEFTPGIEGPACDARGNIYAVNFAAQGTIGRVTPEGQGTVFLRLDNGSIGNGIQIGRAHV